MADKENPIYGPFFGVMGAASAIIFSGPIVCLVKAPSRHAKSDDLLSMLGPLPP